MTIKELCGKLNWNLLCGEGDKEAEGCYIGDLLSRVMVGCCVGDVWITVQTSQNMVAVALLVEAACVVLPEEISLPEETQKRAAAEGVTIVSASSSAYELACALSDEL